MNVKLNSDAGKAIAPIAWYPLLQGFGVRMLLPHEVVNPGDFQLSACLRGKALYCRPHRIGRVADTDHNLVFRYTAWAGDADPTTVIECVRQQIEQAQADAWVSLCEAVDLYRAALSTGKPDLIRMRDMRAIEIMDKNDFGCRVVFDSISGHVWRESGDSDSFEEDYR